MDLESLLWDIAEFIIKPVAFIRRQVVVLISKIYK